MIIQMVRFFPSKNGEAAKPCPALLTESEAICYLRLDETGVEHPADTLRRYRQTGELKTVRVGRCLFYPIEALDEFIRSRMVGGFN